MTQKPMWYANPNGDGTLHRSATEVWWHSYADRIGWDAQYEEETGYYYIPDFKFDQHYGPPFPAEIKFAFKTQQLRPFESKCYGGMLENGSDIVIFGARPFLEVTDDRHCDESGLIAGISNPYRDGCGSRIWAVINETTILALPHCQDDWPDGARPLTSPQDQQWIREIFKDAIRSAKRNPGNRRIQPVLFELASENNGEEDGMVSGR